MSSKLMNKSHKSETEPSTKSSENKLKNENSEPNSLLKTLERNKIYLVKLEKNQSDSIFGMQVFEDNSVFFGFFKQSMKHGYGRILKGNDVKIGLYENNELVQELTSLDKNQIELKDLVGIDKFLTKFVVEYSKNYSPNVIAENPYHKVIFVELDEKHSGCALFKLSEKRLKFSNLKLGDEDGVVIVMNEKRVSCRVYTNGFLMKSIEKIETANKYLKDFYPEFKDYHDIDFKNLDLFFKVWFDRHDSLMPNSISSSQIISISYTPVLINVVLITVLLLIYLYYYKSH